MVNLIPINQKFDAYKADFIEFTKTYFAEQKEALCRDIEKELKAKEDQKLKELEQLKLSKANARYFKKIIQILEELESKTNLRGGKVPIIAEKYRLTIDEAKVIINMVRYARLFKKFVDTKQELIKYL